MYFCTTVGFHSALDSSCNERPNGRRRLALRRKALHLTTKFYDLYNTEVAFTVLEHLAGCIAFACFTQFSIITTYRTKWCDIVGVLGYCGCVSGALCEYSLKCVCILLLLYVL
jgi:hypothetical protein